MVARNESIIILNDREPVPEGTVTFGQLIAEARREVEAEREQSAKQKHHAALYGRWQSMARRHARQRFPADHPIYADIRVWEMYVCRFDAVAEPWFYGLGEDARIDLCMISRDLRRKIGR